MGLSAYEFNDGALIMQYGLVEALLREEELKVHKDWELIRDAQDELASLFTEISNQGLLDRLPQFETYPGIVGNSPIKRRHRKD